MEMHGVLSPESEDEAREQYAAVGPPAQTVVKEAAKAMEFDREEYGKRVTGDVVETARDALFASLLSVRTGTREEFEDAIPADSEVLEEGSPNVENLAWHVAPDGTVVAVTYQQEESAAVATLQRQAFGKVYRDVV